MTLFLSWSITNLQFGGMSSKLSAHILKHEAHRIPTIITLRDSEKRTNRQSEKYRIVPLYALVKHDVTRESVSCIAADFGRNCHHQVKHLSSIHILVTSLVFGH
jgi:hypothetical protein